MENLTSIQISNAYIDIWTEIGMRNGWIRRALDPPVGRDSIVICSCIKHLEINLGMGNWCLGQGFAFQDLCFINQSESGDEWLTIKQNLPFESITFARTIKDSRFEPLIHSLLKASLQQCRELSY